MDSSQTVEKIDFLRVKLLTVIDMHKEYMEPEAVKDLETVAADFRDLTFQIVLADKGQPNG